jgi:hypothetical protein
MHPRTTQRNTRSGITGRTGLFIGLLVLVVGAAFAPRASAVTLTGLDTFIRQTPPNGQRPSDNPNDWTKLDPNGGENNNDITIPSGGCIWIGIENGFNENNKKTLWINLMISPTGKAKHLGTIKTGQEPEAGGHEPDGTPIPGTCSVGYDDAWVTVRAEFEKQPAWEWVKLVNTHYLAIQIDILAVRNQTKCKEAVRSPRNESEGLWSLDLFDASFGVEGWMVNNTRITQIEIYPERCTIDAAAEPAFSADPSTGEWFPEYTFIDPRGDFRPTGGLRWICTGQGLAAQQPYEMSVPLIGEADTMYEVFAWDEDGGEYQQFLMNLGGLPWVETFRHYYPANGMHGQWDWEAWDDDSTFDALTTETHACSDTLSVDIKGDADLVHPFIGADSGKWVFSAQVYVPDEMQEASYFILLNTYPADPDHPENWSLQLQLDGAAGVLKDYLNDAAAPLIRNQWTEIRVEIDLDQDEQAVYYAGVPLLTKGWSDGVSPGGALNIAAVDLYAAGASSVYYDDLVLEHGEMSPCPADLDGDGAVGTSDLLLLLAAWGDAGPGDLDGDGLVGTGDLLQLLAAWGECP